MIRLLFKLIWNQRRKHFGIFFEFFFSFLVLFAVFSFGFSYLKQYLSPLGFDYKDIWVVELDWNDTPEEEISETLTLLKNQMLSYGQIETFSFSGKNIPFSTSSAIDEFSTEGEQVDADVFKVDDRFAELFAVNVQEGRWFGEEDAVSTYSPVVLTASMAEQLFGSTAAAIEQQVQLREQTLKVVGVVDNFRYRGEFSRGVGGGNGIFFRKDLDSNPPILMVKVDQEAKASLEATIRQDLRSIAPGWVIETNYLSDLRNKKLRSALVPLAIVLIISGFLLVNVALGLFGLLWQSISKRRGEIGIRKSMGSSNTEITIQLIGEMLVLASFGLIIGLFFAIQFPILNVFGLSSSVYVGAIIAAVASIYLLVILCAYFPSNQASKLPIANALRFE
ncbi:MAG: ABC transporter permease [Saprospiraceae bacterium]|nr:ABC transporter permease [Saprospiraceae bacterium]